MRRLWLAGMAGDWEISGGLCGMTCECLRDEMAETYKNKKSEYPGQKCWN